MNRRASSLLALAALCGAAIQAAPGAALYRGRLLMDGRPLAVRGVGYENAGVAPCLYARDLPLIAASGANTVRTLSAVAPADKHFTAILDSTGLYWISDFPLDPYADPAATILSQRSRILADLRRYVQARKEDRRLIAIVFGNGVASGYGSKFAGTPDDFYSLLADARRVLRESGSKALLTTAVNDPAEMMRTVEGLDFWSWNAGSRPALDIALAAASAPVLISSFGDPEADPRSATETALAIESRPALIGGIWRSFASSGPGGLVRRVTTSSATFDDLEPRPAFYRLAAAWGGTYPSGWSEASPPRLQKVENETAASAGALVRITGDHLMPKAAPYRDESWPFTLGGTCVCVGAVPARLNSLTPSQLTVQIPPDTEPGERSVLFYRAGRSSNTLPVRIRISADTLAGPILEVD